jgi:hypothetical protein
LAGFELLLNPDKTGINSVSQAIDYPWSRIRHIDVRQGTARKQRSDLVHLFEEALTIARERPKEHVLKYTIGRAEECVILEDNWPLYQGLLCQAAMIEPSVLPLVLRELLTYDDQAKFEINRGLIGKVLSLLMTANAPLGNSSEVAWALWGSIALKVNLDADATAAASQMRDSVVALLCLNASHEGRLDEAAVDRSWWRSACAAESLVGEYWLLAYEADVQKWLPDGIKSGYVASDPAFKVLADNAVRFFEPEYGHEAVVSHPDVSSDASDVGDEDEEDEEDEEEEEEEEDS